MTYICPVIENINKENKYKNFFIIFLIVYTIFYTVVFRYPKIHIHKNLINENSLIYYNKYYKNYPYQSFVIDFVIYCMYAIVSFILYKYLPLKFIASANFMITNILAVIIVDFIIGLVLKLNVNNEVFQLWKNYASFVKFNEIMLDIIILNLLTFSTLFIVKKFPNL